MDKIYRLLALSLLLLFTQLANVASAYNVPGSAAGVLSEVNETLANSIANSLIDSSAIISDFTSCEQRQVDDARRDDCEWRISFRGSNLFMDGGTGGFDYEGSALFGTFTVAHNLTNNTVLLGGLFFEAADLDTSFNLGDIDSRGIGGSLGIIHRFNPDLALSLIGGLEFLNYDVSRSNGRFQGSYDAMRYILDASLNGRAGDGELWMVYRGGLRLIHQKNENYTELDNGLIGTSVSGVDVTSLAMVGDIKIGHNFENITPYLQLTGQYDFLQNQSGGVVLPSVDNSAFFGRVGAGVDIPLDQAMLNLGAGVNFTDKNYQGFDLKLGLNIDF